VTVMDQNIFQEVDHLLKKEGLSRANDKKVKAFLMNKYEENIVYGYLDYRWSKKNLPKEKRQARRLSMTSGFLLSFLCLAIYILIDDLMSLLNMNHINNKSSAGNFGLLILYGILKYGSFLIGITLSILLSVKFILKEFWAKELNELGEKASDELANVSSKMSPVLVYVAIYALAGFCLFIYFSITSEALSADIEDYEETIYTGMIKYASLITGLALIVMLTIGLLIKNRKSKV